MSRRLLTSAALLALGLAAGFTIAQAGSAVALAPQQARPASHTDAPGLDEFIPQGAFVRVAEETQRGLVFIRTEQMVSGESLMEQFRRFFGEENVPDQPEDRVQQSSGSGFLISAEGYIVTNAHVVSQTDVNAHEVKIAETVTVFLNNDDEYEAEVVGVDIGTDLAVLKIDAGADLPFVPMGDSDQSKVGEWVMALGAPFGLTNTVSAGIISAKGRAQVGGPAGSTYQDFIQTDAQINPGNSGGPLVNLRGEVIGINTMILSDRISGQFSGVGFAIPVNLVRGVVDQLIEHGRVIRGWLGISMRSLDPQLADAYGLDRRAVRGAVEISTVNADEPAEMAGVQPGDIVVATDGRELDSDQDFLQRIAMTPPDASITLDIVRMVPDDTAIGLTPESQSISVLLAERPPEIDVLADQNQGSGFTAFSRRPNLDEHELTPIEERFGLLLSELEPNLASELEYRTSDGGIVVLGVLRDGSVVDQGLRGYFIEGTIIRRINMRPVNSIADFEDLIGSFEPGDTAIFDLREPGDIGVRVVVEIPR
jgi:serine protease Do